MRLRGGTVHAFALGRSRTGSCGGRDVAEGAPAQSRLEMPARRVRQGRLDRLRRALRQRRLADPSRQVAGSFPVVQLFDEAIRLLRGQLGYTGEGDRWPSFA